jgi:hypothetical protein
MRQGMKRFKVIINSEAKIIPADSKKDLKAMLRRQLDKQHLVGVEIEALNNHPDNGPGPAAKALPDKEPNFSLSSAVAGRYKVLCECGCNKLFLDSEIMTDDKDRLVGIDCGRKKKGGIL